ncbi:MAG: helix-turn-helix domain-containing protein [Prevotellaceae bacterium]|nr:helix-turn-helix domain-containing protein [Prevotellaceae bacterium]
MNNYNKENKKACYCYDNEVESLIEILELPSGTEDGIVVPTHEIVLIIEGKISYTVCDYPNGALCTGEMILLSSGDRLHYKVDSMSLLLIFRLSFSLYLCQKFSYKQLGGKMGDQKQPTNLFLLRIHSRLLHFAQGVIDVWKDGLTCRLFLRSEISKLLVLLFLYYPKEDLYRFFYPILGPDTAFSEFIWTNHIKYATVNELAYAMNMTSRQFSRRFHQVFGTNPYGWMQQERAKVIYQEIAHGEKPLKEIAADFGFNDQSNFNRFCKTFFNATPGTIRKKQAIV